MAAMIAAALVALAVLAWLPPKLDERIAGLTSADPDPAAMSSIERWRGRAVTLGGRAGVGPASRRRRSGERIRVVQALAALAAELEAGQPPNAALVNAGGRPAVWPVTIATVRLDGDVVQALGADARRHPVLAQLAACWQVGMSSGAGLAPSVARLAASARSAEDVRVQLEAQLAGPRATARMLSVLPLVGIGFGMMLGSDPLSWLVTTSIGLMCLAAGVALTVIGMWWTGRIALRVERML